MSGLLKILTTTLLSLVILFAAVSPALAVDKFSPTLGSFQSALGGDNYNKQTFDFQSLIGVMGGLTTMFTGCTDPSCPPNLRAGALPTMGLAMVDMYANPPASGVQYMADMASKFNIATPAYAQTGTGFRSMLPFLPMWRASRNIAYMLFALAIIVLGLSVMFRSKISPQAVITIQSALPRVIMALLFVTFSYAIVGFMIDLIYVLFGVVVWGFAAAGLYQDPVRDATTYWNQYLTADIGTTYGFIFSKGIEGAGDIARSGTLPTFALGGAGVIAIAVAIIGILTAGGAMVAVAVTMLPFVLGVVLAIFIFLLRVLLTLARAYLMLILHTVLAPFFILVGTMTGRGIWESWLRGVVSNLLVFMGVGLIVFLVEILRRQVDLATPTTWNPTPDTTLWGPPYVGSNGMIINALIALAGLALIPSLPDVINQLLGVRQPRVDGPNAGRQVDSFMGGFQHLVKSRWPGV